MFCDVCPDFCSNQQNFSGFLNCSWCIDIVRQMKTEKEPTPKPSCHLSSTNAITRISWLENEILNDIMHLLITAKREASKHLKIVDIKVICFITPIAEQFQHQKSHLARHSYFLKEFSAWGTEQMWVEKNKDTKFTTINTNNKSYPWPLASLLVFQIGELWSSTSGGKSARKNVSGGSGRTWTVFWCCRKQGKLYNNGICEEDSLCRSTVWIVLGDTVGGIPAHGREIVTRESLRSFLV